jgi:hypothetical protein
MKETNKFMDLVPVLCHVNEDETKEVSTNAPTQKET